MISNHDHDASCGDSFEFTFLGNYNIRVVMLAFLTSYLAVKIGHEAEIFWQVPGSNADSSSNEDGSAAPDKIITGADGYSTFIPRNNSLNGTAFQLVRVFFYMAGCTTHQMLPALFTLRSSIRPAVASMQGGHQRMHSCTSQAKLTLLQSLNLWAFCRPSFHAVFCTVMHEMMRRDMT